MSDRLCRTSRRLCVLVGVLTLLLPGSWDLCVGSNHRGLEPSQTCPGAHESAPDCDAVCGPEDDACRDTPIFDGLALRGAHLSGDEPLQLLPVIASGLDDARCRAVSAHVAMSSAVPAPLPLETIALRC